MQEPQHRVWRLGNEHDNRAGAALAAEAVRAKAPPSEEVVVADELGLVVRAATCAVDLEQQVEHCPLGAHRALKLCGQVGLQRCRGVKPLAVHYEVFLLSRIREEYLASGSTSGAVVEGLARTGRVITAAAAIMVAVFAAFVLSGEVFTKLIGIGLAAAVLIDATVVRMVLVPAMMQLLVDRNWWLPRWLDRVMPQLEPEAQPACTH